MGFLDDLVKVALPAVAGTFLGPVAGKALGASGIMGSPFIQSALTSGAIGLLTGQKPKDALKSALLGGLGQSVFGGMGQAGNIADQATTSTSLPNLMGTGQDLQFMGQGNKALDTAQKIAAATGGGGAIEPTAAKTMSAELLQGLGFAGDPGKENLLFRLANTKVGEGILAGLAAQAADSLFGGDEDEDTRGAFERRPYAAGGPGGKLGGINYNQGGVVQYFNQGGAMDNYPANPPRRDGPINPYEGSGTKDDVPALLTAGEFVMTRDAVEGAGGGDVNRGLNRMYSMMDKFEGMA
tara:strand:- start:6465 stop:7352 length:888 start_codon:yes stop_codon:yes gene_type:complete